MRTQALFLRSLIEVFVTSWVVSQREAIGVEGCRDTVMGPWRRTIGTAFPPNAIGINAGLEARAVAASTLRDICRACGGCELAPKEEE